MERCSRPFWFRRVGSQGRRTRSSEEGKGVTCTEQLSCVRHGADHSSLVTQPLRGRRPYPQFRENGSQAQRWSAALSGQTRTQLQGFAPLATGWA